MPCHVLIGALQGIDKFQGQVNPTFHSVIIYGLLDIEAGSLAWDDRFLPQPFCLRARSANSWK